MTNHRRGKRAQNTEPDRARWFHRKRRAAGLAAVVACLGVAGIATTSSAAPAARDVDDELVSAQLAWEKSSGLAAIVALRRIWEEWERTDPRRVEAALAVAQASSSHTAPERAYARVLGAYARVRRGDFSTAEKSFGELGFVREWLLLGPFDNEGKAGLGREDAPDREPSAPIVPGRAYSGKERPVRWRAAPEVFPFGWVDFGAVFRPPSHVCGYATTFVDGGDKARLVTLWVGASGAHRVVWNGQPVLEETAYRSFDVVREGVTVRLVPGTNRLTLKVCGAEEAPAFSVRLADERGAPDPTLVAHADVERSSAAEAVVRGVVESKAKIPAHPKKLVAPLDEVKRLVDPKNKSRAEDLELAARYLVLTEGDDETVHQARDLAKRAVDAEPTVPRLLLAASLDEDRNGARRSIDRAKKLAGEENVDVLLAEARLLRSGPNPREAFPLLDRVLSLDPDNVAALRGRVELYNAAGLRRSALAMLEEAFERRPHSVLLASMVASQRSSLGLTDEAFEAEERYAARRFDDSAFLSSRLELALARGNEPAANHWLSRLIASDPQNLWAYQVAARVHRSFGHKDRALFDLEKARSIAPEDIGILRSLSDLKGRAGKRDEQLALLQEILRIRPQEVDVRQYVEHIEPPEEPPDEKYAMPAEQFLKRRHAPAGGQNRRVLRDLTVSTVYENGLSSQFRQVVFQPLTDSAAAFSRQYAFQYQADRQTVQLRGARVYRSDGSVDEAIESGEGAADDPSISMYTSSRTFYVQFPRLEPGDVVEARYRIDDVTPRNEFSDYFGEVVYMQSDEPTYDSEYVLVTPKSRKLHVDAQVPGLVESTSETATSRIYRFYSPEVKGIEPEPAMPPWSELLGFVHVSTYPTWDALGAWYWGLVKEQLDLDAETRKLARDITKDAKTDLEKVQAVYGWVVKNTRYVALEFGIYGFKPRRCVQTVARGWGDCKDKATVIVTLLRELGIPSHLVIVRTGMRGRFGSKLPSLAPFDHAIAYVPSLDLYLDGTAEYTGSSELPVMDQGAMGLVVLDGKAELRTLPPGDPKKNVIARKVGIELGADGSAEVTLDYETRGHAASGWRSRYEAEATRKERLAQDLGHEFPGLEIAPQGIKTGDLADLEHPVTLSVRGRAPGLARQEGDRLSVPVTLGTRLTSTYASLSTRKQDVLLTGFSTREETVTVKIPPGYRVDAPVPDVDRSTRFGSYRVRYRFEGGKVTVESRLELTVDRVKPADYAEFRRFSVEADQALSHRLLLSR